MTNDGIIPTPRTTPERTSTSPVMSTAGVAATRAASAGSQRHTSSGGTATVTVQTLSEMDRGALCHIRLCRILLRQNQLSGIHPTCYAGDGPEVIR